MSVKGLGTEQLEAVLRAKFKDTPVFRVDSDTISNVTVLHNTFDHIREQSSAVLLGTQMLSKGHHFPDVTCVVVVNADGQLFNPDFRAEERLLQILVQVAGRSGRSEKPGEVLIQTRQPEHPLINQALTASYDSLADALLLQRQRLKLPPYGGLGLVRCDSQRFEDGARFLNDLKSKLTPQLSEGVKLVGAHANANAKARWSLSSSNYCSSQQSKRCSPNALSCFADRKISEICKKSHLVC